MLVKTQRGVKEFQFDQVFMEQDSQEKVFEDTKVRKCSILLS